MSRVLGIIAGLVTGFILVYLLEMVGHMIYPPPEGIDTMNPEDIARVMDQLPLGGLISVVVAWFLGTLGAAFVATRVAKERGMTTAYTMAGLFLLLGVFNFFAIPHPIWMIVAGILAYALGAHFGGKMGLWKDPDKVLKEVKAYE